MTEHVSNEFFEYKPTQEYAPLPEGQPFIPEGWTYLAHGTSVVEWRTVDLNTTPEIEVAGMGLSVVSREMAEQSQVAGRGTTAGYAAHRRRPEGMDEEEFSRLNIPIEFRVLFYPQYASAGIASEQWKDLPTDTRELVARYYYRNHQRGRHPLVPRGERLLLLKKDVADDGHAIYYYLPASVRDDYMRAMEVAK